MTLPRLTDDSSKAAYGSMLRKARRDSLSPEAERRIASTVLAPSVALPSAPASTLRAFLVKGVLGLSALALVSTFFVVSSHLSEAPAPAAGLAPAPPSAAKVEHEVAAPTELAPREDAALSVHDLPAAAPVEASTAAPSAATVSAARPASAALPDDSLGAEAASLRAVHEDIVNGRSSEALRKLDQYDARFRGKGAMAEEASVERVEAMLRVGRTQEARALATRLLTERPNGPFARKLRSLLASSSVVGAPTSTDDADSKR